MHSFDEKNNCLADITLRDTGVVISNLKVMPGLGDGIMVHMPSWMHTRWSYTEVQWSEVRQIVTREYLAAASAKKQSDRSNTGGTQICTFYSSVVRVEADAMATITSTNEQIDGIHLVHTKEKDIIQVFMPREMNYYWNKTCIEWDQLVEIVTNEYRRQVLGEDYEYISDSATIEFRRVQEVTSCMADVNLPHKKSTIKGFRIKKTKGEERVVISTPKWMGRWNDSRLTWYDLCSLITSEYNKSFKVEGKVPESHQKPIDKTVLSEDDEPSTKSDLVIHGPKQQAKEKKRAWAYQKRRKLIFHFLSENRTESR